MDKTFVLNGVSFVWDVEKAKHNYLKHGGLTFLHAADAFFDPFLRVIDASQNNEQRDAIIGMDKQWRLLYVVHISHENEAIRIISARKATKEERRYYEN